jgi:tetratricopeptide (TPR) repeat protein
MDKKILDEIDALLRQNEVKKAEVIIARNLRTRPLDGNGRANIMLRRAKARLASARADDALEDLQTAIALNPSLEHTHEAVILKGDIHFARFELAPVGFTDRTNANIARECYEQVVEEAAEQASWVHYQLGRIAMSENEIDASENHFLAALKTAAVPERIHAMSYERLGFIALFEQRTPETALQYFQQAIEHYPANDDPGWLIQLYLRVSRCYLELKQYDNALEAARKALRDIQTGTTSSYRVALPEAHFALGEILADMPGNEEEAIEHYLRYLQSSKRPPGIDVTWSQVHETIAGLSFKLERYLQAINAYEKALEFNPYHPWEANLRYQIARCHYRMRDYEKSVASVEKVVETARRDKTPITDWRVYNLMGNAYFALEKYKMAAEAYQHAVELAPVGAAGLEKTHIYLRFSQELMQSIP